jgi:mannose-6-phosphate isomerase-like protein (cupin superfamily)
LAVWPGGRYRAGIVRDKLTGDARMPWTEVLVRMAPWSLQPAARGWLGPRAEPWIKALNGIEQEADAAGRVRLFNGPTATLRDLHCHFSILPGGTTPHPPHIHQEEELILPLSGEVEVLRGTAFDALDLKIERAKPGSVIFHASESPHTIRNPGTEPVSYLVLRWVGRSGRGEGGLAAQTIDLGPRWEALAAMTGPSVKQFVVDEPTALLPKLHLHVTRLEPGGESPEHVDAYDVILLTMEGELETLDQRVQANSVVFLPANRPHAMRNTGDGPARYLVIELHSAD